MSTNKIEILKEWFKDKDKVLLAYSGGIDSSFLLKVGFDVLGEKIIPVTVYSPINSIDELESAKETAKEIGVKNHLVINYNDLDSDDVRNNPENRCYFCKKNRFLELKKIAKDNDSKVIIEGTNFDDLSDYRPGLKAIQELGIQSPLLDLKFTKTEIRQGSKELGLKNWNKVPEPCLATRFPVGTRISESQIEQIYHSERFLKELMGIELVRVRIHGNLARIEVEEKNIKDVIFLKDIIQSKLLEFGFKYVSMDLVGYKKGSMN